MSNPVMFEVVKGHWIDLKRVADIRIIDFAVRVGDCEACLLVTLALPSMVENVKFDMKNHRAAQRFVRLLVNAIRRIPR